MISDALLVAASTWSIVALYAGLCAFLAVLYALTRPWSGPRDRLVLLLGVAATGWWFEGALTWCLNAQWGEIGPLENLKWVGREILLGMALGMAYMRAYLCPSVPGDGHDPRSPPRDDEEAARRRGKERRGGERRGGERRGGGPNDETCR